MSDVINDDDPGGFAAEYVLGTLDASERTRAQRLLGSDHSFTAMVKIWERRLGELHLMVEPVEPDASLWLRIRSRIQPQTGGQPGPAPAVAGKPASEPVLPASAAAPVAAAPTTDLVPNPGLRVVAGDAPPPIAPTPASVEIAPAVAPMAPDQQLPEVAASPAEITLISSAQTVPSQPELVAVAAATEELKALARPLEPTVVMPTADRRPVPADRAPRALRHWRAFAILMMLLAFGFAGLIAAWRYAPDRLPPQLRPLEVLHMQPSAPAAAARRPAPPGSQFDE